MKKLLLLAAAALTVVACKKDNDNPPTPTPTPGQTETPAQVPAGFVKQTIETFAGTNTKTTTYNVVDNVLRGWTETSSQGTVTHTLEYNGKNLRTYHYQDGGRQLDELYTFVYNDNKLTNITLKDSNAADPETFTVTTDTSGRITKKINTGEGHTTNIDPWELSFTYGENSLQVVNTKEGTATYTYTYNNGNVTIIEMINTQRIVNDFEYDTTVVNNLNNQYLLLAAQARLNIRGHYFDFGQENDPFVKQSKNIVKKFMFYTYDIDKNGNKPTKIVKKDNAGNEISTIEYKY